MMAVNNQFQYCNPRKAMFVVNNFWFQQELDINPLLFTKSPQVEYGPGFGGARETEVVEAGTWHVVPLEGVGKVFVGRAVLLCAVVGRHEVCEVQGVVLQGEQTL